MNSMQLGPSEYEFMMPQPMVQLPRDVNPGSEAEVFHRRSVQRWSTLDLWQRLCRAFRFMNSPSNMQPLFIS